MKLNFTKIGMLIFLFFGVQNLSAQDPNVLTITAPDEIAGNYLIATANDWGGTVATFSGTATFVNDGVDVITDGCEPLVDDMTGKWAFIDRGICQFADKALSAQNQGAQLAIICNNDTSAPDELPPLGAGDVADQVTIPVIGLTYNDCLRIRMVAEGADVGVQTRYFCGSPTYPPSVVWGDEPGQGDFNGGMGDWTFENACGDGWRYTTNQGLPIGTFTEGSACNGFMNFPSWWTSTEGGGTDIIDPFQNIFCDGSLYSPNIDLSGESIDGLFCEFWHNAYYYYGGYTQLTVSYDDGVTYPDTMVISAGATIAAAANPIPPAIQEGCQFIGEAVNEGKVAQYRIPLTGYDGQGQVKLQFMHSGGFYHATIDDVILTNGGQYYDLSIGQNYITSAPAYRTPISQAQEIPFHADIVNLGNVDCNDPEVTASVELNGNIVFSAVNNQFASQPPASCFLNENFSFTDMFVPTEVGVHRMNYDITSADDKFSSNNTTSNTFEMTNDIWSTASATETRVTIFDNLLNQGPGETGFIGFQWAIAYPFYIPNGSGHFLNTVTIGVEPLPTTSGSITTYVYKWSPSLASFPNGPNGNDGTAAGGPSGFDYRIAPEDTELVGICGNVFGQQRTSIPLNSSLQTEPGIDFENITMTMAQANRMTGDFETDNDGNLIPLELEDGSQYVLVFAIVPTDEEVVNFRAVDAREGTPYYPAATNYAYAYNGSYVRSLPMLATLDNEGDFGRDIEQLSFERFSTANIPWLEMNISETSISTEEITEAAAQSISIFPNPVIDQINVNINLEETSDVSFELMDINGKTVKRSLFNDIKTAELTIAVKDVVPGVYTLNVRSEAGFTAKKVIVQR